MVGSSEVLFQLIAQASDARADRTGPYALVCAALGGQLAAVAELAETVDVNSRISRVFPLWAAALNGHLDVVVFLVDRGASVAAVPYNTTPLWIAASNGHVDVVSYLASRGACVCTGGSWLRTPLWAAAWHGHAAVVAWLIAHGADVDARDAAGDRSPLWCAVNNGHHAAAEVLLVAGADARGDNHPIQPPLMRAAVHNDVAMMRLLVTRARVKISIDDERMITEAACAGAADAVEWLAAAGADLGRICHDDACHLTVNRRPHLCAEHGAYNYGPLGGPHPGHLTPRHARVAAFLRDVVDYSLSPLEIAIGIGDVRIVAAALRDGVDVCSRLPVFAEQRKRWRVIGVDPPLPPFLTVCSMRTPEPPMAALLRAASRPWSRTRHGLFGKLPRQQVTTLLHCGVRLRLPTEVMHIVCSFITRTPHHVDTAWPDRLAALVMCAARRRLPPVVAHIVCSFVTRTPRAACAAIGVMIALAAM